MVDWNRAMAYREMSLRTRLLKRTTCFHSHIVRLLGGRRGRARIAYLISDVVNPPIKNVPYRSASTSSKCLSKDYAPFNASIIVRLEHPWTKFIAALVTDPCRREATRNIRLRLPRVEDSRRRPFPQILRFLSMARGGYAEPLTIARIESMMTR